MSADQTPATGSQEDPEFLKALKGNDPLAIQTNPATGDRLCIPCHDKAHDPCCVTQLIVRCGHNERSYVVRAPTPPPLQDAAQVIQVLADTPTLTQGVVRPKDTLSVTLVGGPCVLGRPGATGGGIYIADYHTEELYPSVSISGPDVAIKAAAPLKFYAYSPHDPGESWSDLIAGLFDYGRLKRAYTVQANGCAGTQDIFVTVEAFPEMSLTGTIVFQWASGSDAFGLKRATVVKDGRRTRRINSEITLSGNLEYKLGTKTFVQGTPTLTRSLAPIDPSAGPLKYLPLPKGLPFKNIQNFVEDLIAFFAFFERAADNSLVTGSNVQAKIIYPSISLGGGIKAYENTADWTVERQGRINLGLKPLLGFEMKLDILFIILDMAEKGAMAGGIPPVWSKMLKKLREAARGDEDDVWDDRTGRNKMRKGVEIEQHEPEGETIKHKFRADVGIYLTISGRLDGEFEWRLEGGSTGNFDPNVAIVLNGYATVEYRQLLVSIGAYGEIGLKSKVGFKLAAMWLGRGPKGEGPGWTGQFYFDGLKAYFIYSFDVGIGDSALVPTPPSGRAPLKPGEQRVKKDTARPKTGDTVEWIWIEPVKIPKIAGPIDIANGDF